MFDKHEIFHKPQAFHIEFNVKFGSDWRANNIYSASQVPLISLSFSIISQTQHERVIININIKILFNIKFSIILEFNMDLVYNVKKTLSCNHTIIFYSINLKNKKFNWSSKDMISQKNYFFYCTLICIMVKVTIEWLLAWCTK